MNTNTSLLKIDSFEVKLNSMIGEGGQGTIFSARNSVDNSSLAVKIVDISNIMSRINFRAEQEVVELIKPSKMENICDVYEYIEKNDFGYALMKRYNCDLFDFAVEQRGISEELGKSIFRKIVTGLLNLHACGVAHLDIKPENIMMDVSSNPPFIGDFGSCYIFKDTDAKCHIKRGTKQYYPPEYASTHSFDPRKVDIYCLGVTLHAMLTGYFPYNTAEPIDQRTIHCSNKLSPQCADLIHKMLRNNPKKRIPLNKVMKHAWVSDNTIQHNNFKSTIIQKANDILHFPTKILRLN